MYKNNIIALILGSFLTLLLLLGCVDEDSDSVIADEREPSLLFRSPSDVAATDGYIYVTNVNYLSYQEGYGEGFVVVIDKQNYEVLGKIPTQYKNPQFIERVNTQEGELLIISSTGELSFTQEGVRLASEGGIEIWKETENPLQPTTEHFPLGQRIELPQGGPGKTMLTPDTRYLYIVSAVAPVLFKFDLLEREWVYDANNPLALYESHGDVTHGGAIDSMGYIYITSFNDDALFVLDTQCDRVIAGPIDLGRVPGMMEGPHSVVVNRKDNESHVYYNMSISNVIGKAVVQHFPASDHERCSTQVDSPPVEVMPSLQVVGPFSNALTLGANALWVVESGANTVSRLSLDDYQWRPGFIDVGNDRNPYEFYYDGAGEGLFYITNYLANSVSVARVSDGRILAEIK